MMAHEEVPDLLSALNVELSARSGWLSNIDSLDFINDPAKSGPYQYKTPDELLRSWLWTPTDYLFLFI